MEQAAPFHAELNPEIRSFIAKAGAGEKITADGVWFSGEGAAAETARPYNITDLIQLRQAVRQAASPYKYGDPNAQALRKLLEATDDTIELLVKASGDESAIAEHQKVRAAFQQKAWAYEDPAVVALKEGRTDDVWAMLTSPQSLAPRGSMNAMKIALGDHWAKFAKDSLDRKIADAVNADGSPNYSQVLNELNSMGTDIRFAIYGQHGEDVLETLTRVTI